MALRVCLLPEAPVCGVHVERLPTPRILRDTDLPEYIASEFLDALASGIRVDPLSVEGPRANQLPLVVIEFHCRVTRLVAPGGIGPFGRINSRAPPAVRPPPTNPGFVRLTGVARPSAGVSNSKMVNSESGSMVSFLAI